MSIIIAYIGRKGCVMASDKRRIAYFGDKDNREKLEEELYSGNIRNDEELYKEAAKLGIDLKISDDAKKIKSIGNAVMGEVSSKTTREVRRRRIYGTTNGYQIIELIGSELKNKETGSSGIIIFGTYLEDYSEPAFEESTEIVKCTSETSGTINGYEYVDLGLSVMWATTNLHADNPQNAGRFFQWGNIHDHTHPEGMANTFGFFDSDVQYADDKHDPARSKMGGRWRIPRKKEIEDLFYLCDWELVMIQNKKCYKITGLNGNSIILPLAGYYHENGKYYNQESMYFCGELHGKEGVYYISMTDSVVEMDRAYSERYYYAVPVRAVANLKCMDIWEYLRRVLTGSINPFSRY